MKLRRLALVALTFTTIAMAAPSSALADHDMCGWANPSCSNDLASSMVSANPGYKGWGTAYCDFHTISLTGYAWNGAWSRRTVACRTQVYIWPYANGWSWAWTQSTGWLAMRGSDLQWRTATR
ncbi:MAG: hypothetical protein JWL76_1508 [Thermoleophilia bacterium]|nr:hypothetical protein [Thermoleophilia bacterium]